MDLRRTGFAVLVLLLAGCASNKPTVVESPPVWKQEFERPVDFQMLASDDLLVVGTLRHLYGIDPATGRTRWRQRNVAVSSSDLIPLDERGYLLVSDTEGGAFHDRDTNILAIEQATGRIVWESRLVEGKILQGVLDSDGEVLYFTNVPRAHGDDRGFLAGVLGKGLGSGFEQQPILNALDVATGRVLWSQPFEREVRMRPSYAPQLDDKDDWSYVRPFDLGLYHPPIVAGDRVCVTYAGIHCYDRFSGKLLWKHRFDVIEHDLALSYAPPAVAGNTLIVTGDNRVRAYDLDTGKTVWRSRRLDVVSELFLSDDVIYGQLGGRFLDLDAEKWEWEGEFGVVALDRRTGKQLWKYDDADDAISNVLIYGDRIWLADERRLIVLDRRTGDVRLRQEHGFETPPEFTALNELGQIVLVGEGQAAAFDAIDAEPLWSVYHPPIGPGAWSAFADGLRRSTGNVLKFVSFVVGRAGGVLPSLSLPLGSVDFTVVSTKRVVSNSLGRSGRRMAYRSASFEGGEGNAALSGNYQYFVTEPKGYDKPALAMVDLTTGKTVRFIGMDSERPNLVIDEGQNEIYAAFQNRLTAVPLESRTAFAAASPEPAEDD